MQPSGCPGWAFVGESGYGPSWVGRSRGRVASADFQGFFDRMHAGGRICNLA